MTSGQVMSIELAVIIVQLAAISPALSFVRAGVAKLLAHFKLDKAPSSASDAK